ncbi:MAG TPA: peptidoglycan bridge formation glycyltransferase FemA/FemB family protein [Patescibacteria group bacterium]|nr:peptidoglycan bridge formation glycyltransferase FemA/FemB family protein [Patescibacteria group bacterium]
MSWQNITPQQQDQYNSIVNHPLQSYEWGEFREKTGVKVIRKGFFKKDKLVSGFQLTIHKIPHTNYTIGYLPKGEKTDKEMLEELTKIGKENNCIFIQLEPNLLTHRHPEFISGSSDSEKMLNQVQHDKKNDIVNFGLVPSFHPLFTKYTFVLDLTKSEEELLKDMHSKTRYNIKVAQKHNVQIVEDNSEKAFEVYWQIVLETTSRQKFYAHTKKYHQLQWKIFAAKSNEQRAMSNELQYHLLLAKYQQKSLAAWVLFTFHDTLYYPYGSSTSEHRETMASNLMMWEAIKFGKKLGLKKFDMWGSLSDTPDTKDPWYGFHRFKQGYGPELVEFVGSFDLVINPIAYQGYKFADKLRWLYLRLKK